MLQLFKHTWIRLWYTLHSKYTSSRSLYFFAERVWLCETMWDYCLHQHVKGYNDAMHNATVTPNLTTFQGFLALPYHCSAPLSGCSVTLHYWLFGAGFEDWCWHLRQSFQCSLVPVCYRSWWQPHPHAQTSVAPHHQCWRSQLFFLYVPRCYWHIPSMFYCRSACCHFLSITWAQLSGGTPSAFICRTQPGTSI